MASPGRHGDSCPICLQLYPPLDKAVISSCLHAFCISCLAAWCERKRACPVCRGSVSSYYHTIQSDNDFLEHVFPAEAAAAATAGLATAAGQQQQQQRRGLFDVDALLDLQQEAERLSATVNSFTARLGIQQLQQQQQQRGETAVVRQDGSSQEVEEAGRVRQPRIQLVQERFTSWGDPEGWMHHVRHGHQQQQQQQQQQPGRSSSSRRDPQQQQQQQQSDHGSGTARGSIGRAAQPRPYFWRMQQHLMASLHHPPSSLSSSNAQADAAQSARLSRRAVYLSNRWAKPYEPPAHAPLFASSSRAAAAAGSSRGSDGNSGGGLLPRVSDVALQSWLERELQALLLDQDVTIVCAYVRGLINSFGLQQQRQQHQGTTASGFAAASSNGAGSTAEAMQQVAAAAASATAAGLPQQSQGQSLRSPAAAADATDPSPQPSGAGTSIPDAAAALQSFLFDHAAHFWHELSCFALSGLTVAAWDRVVQYGPPPGQQRQQQLPLPQPTQRRQQPVVSECAQQQQQQLQVCRETREPSPQVGSSSGSNGSSRKRTRVGHSGWDVPPAAAAAAAAAVTHLRRPAAAAAAAAAVAEQHGSADGRAVEQQQQGSGDDGSERHAACSRQGQSHRRSRGVRSRSGSRSRSRSRSKTGRGFRHRNKHYTNHSSRNSRKPSRRHSSSSRSPVGRSQRIVRSQQVQGRPTERSWQQQQQQEWAGHVRGSAGWQQAVLLKQLGAERGGSWRQQQQQHVPSSERWEME